MLFLKVIQMTALTGVVTAAVLSDLYSGRIPNAVIVTGLAFGFIWQLFAGSLFGVILFLGGACLPLLLLGILYYYRMLGAGDIKLLCVAGGFLGPEQGLTCMVWSALAGAALAVFLMHRNHSFVSRMFYFLDYVSDYAETKEWKPYIEGADEKARFCFSVPVLIGVLCCVCGMQ